MRTHADHIHPASPAPPQAARPSADDRVDLDDPAAVKRAISMHQAGKAVFAIPFNARGAGTLTWLDPTRGS